MKEANRHWKDESMMIIVGMVFEMKGMTRIMWWFRCKIRFKDGTFHRKSYKKFGVYYLGCGGCRCNLFTVKYQFLGSNHCSLWKNDSIKFSIL